jgi:hypothetical protein
MGTAQLRIFTLISSSLLLGSGCPDPIPENLGSESDPEADAGDLEIKDSGTTSDDGGTTDSGSPILDSNDAGPPQTMDGGSFHSDSGFHDSGSQGSELNPPEFPHLDALIDAHRGDTPVWATFIHITPSDDEWSFAHHTYNQTGSDKNFWPASVIKIYPALSALALIKEWDVSLDADVTFFHRAAGEDWVEDLTRSVRDMIYGSFNCSSNSDYTLLLRLAGIDWMNTEFLTAGKGFSATALMRGYVTDRPWVYTRDEEQMVRISDGNVEVERTHLWSGTSYADNIGCSVYNTGGTANCSPTDDMAEVMRRIMFHESLDTEEQYDVREEDLDWLRFGGSTLQMNNKDCSTPWQGIQKVLPNAEIYHKGGLVSEYALGVHHIFDTDTDTSYILALATESTSTALLIKLSEEIARMALTPRQYVHLDYLVDNVNPIEADLMVYSEYPGTLNLLTKPYDEDASDPLGWEPLDGTLVDTPAGTSWHTVSSICFDESGTQHIKGQLQDDILHTVASSDLHYVVVDAEVMCENQ